MDSETINNTIVLQTTTNCVQSAMCRTKMIQQKNLENFQIVWLDADIYKTQDNLQTIALLRATVNYVEPFEDYYECYEHIGKIKDEKVFLIVSGSISQHIVPYLYYMPQVQYVYVYCFETDKYQTLAHEYEIIRGLYTNMNDICEQLSKDVIECSHQFLSMNIISTHIKEKEINKQEASFMYFQQISEILIRMESDDDAKPSMVNYCRLQYNGNERVLKDIEEFNNNYTPDRAVWWYTTHCFVYEILNKALRIQDIDILLKYRFFLTDLHNQIKQLHTEESLARKNESTELSPLTVYRGQRITREELEHINNNNGGLLSFNNFLSTSTNLNVASKFISGTEDSASVLFEIQANYTQDTKPFSHIDHLSQFNQEGEVLFTIGCVFRIESIQRLENNVSKVSLTLTKEEDPYLKELREYFLTELGDKFNLIALGKLMLYIGKYDDAEQIFKILLPNDHLSHMYPVNERDDEVFDDHDNAYCNNKLEYPEHGTQESFLSSTSRQFYQAITYHNIGLVYYHKGEYDKALEYYEKGLEIELKSLSDNRASLATNYGAIGNLYHEKGEYDKALEYHEKCLKIELKLLPRDDHSLAVAYGYIGEAYKEKGQYDKALESHEESLKIVLESLPQYHPSLATAYRNIGEVYYMKGEYDTAMQYYEKGLQIELKSLPGDHPLIATAYGNIGSIYKDKAQHDKALECHEKSLKIMLKSLPPHHPSLATTYWNIGEVYLEKGEYDKALEYYEKGLEIELRSLPDDHRSLTATYGRIGKVYQDKGKYDKALEYYEKGLEIELKRFPSHYKTLATTYGNIGAVYQDKCEYDKALEYHEKELKIILELLPQYHPSIATAYGNIGAVYHNKDEYDMALEYYEIGLEIRLKSLAGDHPSIANSYGNIGAVYHSKDEYDKALEYYEKGLEIGLRSLPGDHPSIATAYGNIGAVYHNKNEYDKALEYCKKGLQIELKSLPDDHPSLTVTYWNIGKIYHDSGKYDNALEYYEKGVEIELKRWPSHHPSLATTCCLVGLLYGEIGEYDKALKYYGLVLRIMLKSPSENDPPVVDIYYYIAVICYKKLLCQEHR